MALLGFLNYRAHPDDKNKTVFYYRYADVFEAMQQGLSELGVPYETVIEDDGTPTFYVIVSRHHMDSAQEANNAAQTRYKKPFLADTGLRWVLMGIFFIAVAIALTGYIISQFS